MSEIPNDVKGVADAVLSCAGMLGIPPITLGAEAAKLLIDLGFEYFFHATENALRAHITGQTAGGAMQAAQAATSAREATLRILPLVLRHHEKIVELTSPDHILDEHAVCACMGWTSPQPGETGPTWEEHVTAVARAALGGNIT